MPASHCPTRATRRSWSTATLRRSRPTTTPATGCTSSRITLEDVQQHHRGRTEIGGAREVGPGIAGDHREPRWSDATQAGRACYQVISIAGYQSAESIDLAEDRERWNSVCAQLEIPQPPGGTAVKTSSRRMKVVAHIGYPALVRPSYVLGGRAMSIVYDDDQDSERLIDELTASREVWAARVACQPSVQCCWTASSRMQPRSMSMPSEITTGETVIGGSDGTCRRSRRALR